MQIAARAHIDGDPSEPTVLVVDDDILTRMLVADELRRKGLNVLEAASADEALALLDAGAPMDLMLTDVQMEGSMDGLGLARAVRARCAEAKIVLASGFLKTAPGSDVADAFFPKPYAPSAVAERVVALLAEGRE
jgi:CheY-like chemotaxis protein